MLRPTRLLASLAVLASLAAGCGGGASSGETDPAALLPAGAIMYGELVVRPEGEQEEEMRALASRLLRTEKPGPKIVEMLEKAFNEGEDDPGSYAKDVKPWLGERMGVAILEERGDDDPRVALAVASRDDDAAAEQIAQESKEDKSRQASHKDVDYWVDPDGAAAGVVGHAVVFGTDEAAFKRVIDTAEGGASLAESKVFEEIVDELPDEREGLYFVDTRRLGAIAAAGEQDPAAAEFSRKLFEGMGASAGALLAEENGLALEMVGATPKAGTPLASLAAGSGTTPLLRELPGEGTWAAFGAPKLGDTIKGVLDVAAGALGGAVVRGQIERETGLNLEKDVYGWMGDVAAFARGEQAADMDGGLVIEVTDADAALTGITKMVGALRRTLGFELEPTRVEGARTAFRVPAGMVGPEEVVVALNENRAVFTYGADAAAEALDPAEKLGDTELYQRAEEATGETGPVLVVDFSNVMGLIAEGAAGDPDFAKAKPYLEMIDLVALGSKIEGDVARSRFAVTLR